MTTEQKAKAYDKALEWMRKVYPTLTGAAKEDAEYYFPELKESEDERIRKELWEYFHELELSSDSDFSPSFTIDDILAWLEKQKEQKPTVSIKDATKFGNLEYERGVKDGIQHAKNHQWKPSEKQILALRTAVIGCPDDKELLSLYEDLKKL